MWRKTDWNAASIHPTCSGDVWSNGAGSLAYYDASAGKYTISTSFPPLSVSIPSDLLTLRVSGRTWGGLPYLTDGNGWYFWRGAWTWQLSKCLGGGISDYDEHYEGPLAGTLAPRGTALANGTSAWISDSSWPRHVCDAQAGIYVNASDSSDKRFLGRRYLQASGLATLAETIGAKPCAFTGSLAVGTAIYAVKLSQGLRWKLSLSSSDEAAVLPSWECSADWTGEGTYSKVWTGTDEQWDALPDALKLDSVMISFDHATMETAPVPGYACEIAHYY